MFCFPWPSHNFTTESWDWKYGAECLWGRIFPWILDKFLDNVHGVTQPPPCAGLRGCVCPGSTCPCGECPAAGLRKPCPWRFPRVHPLGNWWIPEITGPKRGWIPCQPFWVSRCASYNGFQKIHTSERSCCYKPKPKQPSDKYTMRARTIGVDVFHISPILLQHLQGTPSQLVFLL